MLWTSTRSTMATLALLMAGLVLGQSASASAEDSWRAFEERSYEDELLVTAYTYAVILGDDEMADLLEMIMMAPDWWLDGLEPKPSPGPRPAPPNRGPAKIDPLPSPKPRYGVGRIGAIPLPSPKPRFRVGRVGIAPLPSPKPRARHSRTGAAPLPSPKPIFRGGRIGIEPNPSP